MAGVRRRPGGEDGGQEHFRPIRRSVRGVFVIQRLKKVDFFFFFTDFLLFVFCKGYKSLKKFMSFRLFFIVFFTV